MLSPARRAAHDRRRARRRPGGHRAGRDLAARRRRPRGRPTDEAGPLRRQHALRRASPRATRPRPSTCFGVQVNTWGVNDLADAVAAAEESAVDALVAEYDEALRRRAGAARGRRAARVAALRRPARARAAVVPRGGRLRRLHHEFEDLGALRQLPGLAVQRLMADGYGFGAEGDWKTAVLVRIANVMGEGLPGGASPHGGLHVRPHARIRADPRRAHARGEPVADDAAAVARGASARHRRPRGPGAARLRRGPGARRRGGPVATSATASASSRTWSTSWPRRIRCRSCPSGGPCGSRAPTSAPPRRPG